MEQQGKVIWAHLAPKMATIFGDILSPSISESLSKAADEFSNLAQKYNEQEYSETSKIIAGKNNSFSLSLQEALRKNIMDWGRPVSSKKQELSLVTNELLEDDILIDKLSSIFEKNNKMSFSALENALVMIWGAYRVLTVGSFDAKQTSEMLSDIPDSVLHPHGLAHALFQWSKEIDLPQASRRMFVIMMNDLLQPSVANALEKVIEEFRVAGWNIPKAALLNKPARQSTTVSPSEAPADMTLVPQGDFSENIFNDRYENVFQNTSDPQALELPTFTDNVISDDVAEDVAKKLFGLMGTGKWKKKYEMEGNLLNQEIGENWDNNLPQFLTMIHTRHQKNQTRTENKFLAPSEYVYDALKVMQASPGQTLKDHKSNKEELLGQLKKEILDSVAKMLPEESRETMVLSDNDNDAVDVVGTVFDIFLAERVIEPSLKDHILDIIPVYVRIAIDDKKFFMNKKHPARVFLDSIVEGCEANEGSVMSEMLVLQESRKSIDEISRNFDGDMTIFDQMSSNIQNFSVKNKESAQKTEDRTAVNLKHTERLENADMETRKVFVHTLKSTYWPIFCTDMLEEYWSPFYKIILLQSKNPQNDPVKTEKSLRHAEKLLRDIVDIGRYGLDKERFDIQSIHKEIMIMLGSSGLTESAAHETALEIWSAMDQACEWNKMSRTGKIGMLSKLMMATPSLEEENISGEAKVEETSWVDQEIIKAHAKNITLSEIPTDKELIEYFSNLPIGTWVDFKKSDGEVLPAKLSFVSPISNRLVFVTAKGTRHAVETPHDLAIMVKLDKMRLRDQAVGAEGFEGSFKKAIKKLDQEV